MNHRSSRLMFVFMFVFSVFALACNAMSTPRIVPTVVPTVSYPQPTAAPAATQSSGGASDPQPTESGGFSFGTEDLPADIPILPDATDMLASSSSVMYTTQHTKDDASQFYMTEMEKLGWTFDPNASINGEVANIIHFTSGSKTASIIIGTATGQVKVQIAISG